MSEKPVRQIADKKAAARDKVGTIYSTIAGLLAVGAVAIALLRGDPEWTIAVATAALSLLTFVSIREGQVTRKEQRERGERQQREVLYAALAELRAAEKAFGFQHWVGFPTTIERDALRRSLSLAESLPIRLNRALSRADSFMSGFETRYMLNTRRALVEGLRMGHFAGHRVESPAVVDAGGGAPEVGGELPPFLYEFLRAPDEQVVESVANEAIAVIASAIEELAQHLGVEARP